MDDRTLFRLVIVTLVLAFASNALVLKELKATAAAGGPDSPPANEQISACRQFCNRLDERYTITPDGFSDWWVDGSCNKICIARSVEWINKCWEKYPSGDGRKGCLRYKEILQKPEPSWSTV